MSAKIIWIHIGLVALLAGGIAIGILYHHHVVRPYDLPCHGGHPGGHRDATPFADHFRKRLGLTDEQTAKVRATFDALHLEMMGLAKEFQDKFKTLRSRAWTEVRGTLSEKQQPEFDRLVEELEKRHTFH